MATLTRPSTAPSRPSRTLTERMPAVRKAALPYGLLVPTLLALVFALGYPLVRQVILSFQDFGLRQQFGAPPEWIGLQNYRELVSDRYLWILVLRSVVFCLVNAGLTMVLGVAIALLMRLMSTSVRLVVQTGLLIAWAMPVLASLTVFTWLFDTQYGVVNWVLDRLGGDFAGHSWLIEPMSFFLVATILVVWMSIPFVAFTVYAALTQVPQEVMEAAEVDGAGPWQRTRLVVLPSIRPVLLVVGLLEVVWGLRVFTQIYVLQQAGGVTHDTNLLGTYVYRSGIGEGEFGIAATVAMFMLALTVLLTAPYVIKMLRDDKELA